MQHEIIPCRDQTINPPIDRNDPECASTAVELEFPETFSHKAWLVIRYMEAAMYLYLYKGEYILTDESLYLTDHGDGSHEAPLGGPRYVAESLEEVEQWLEELADCYDEEGDIPGWEVETE